MRPRSASDKEYFAQDWFIRRIEALRLPLVQQGRNSYPDFWVGEGDNREGYEIKSLAFADGRPARRDLDFNSTIPSGRKQGHEVFLVFFLYTGKGSAARRVHSVSIAHADLINADHALADAHLNVAIHNFGSYADGFIRNRKMYVFPHPIALDPTGVSRIRLIVPATWRLRDRRLRQVGRIVRVVAPDAVSGYTIQVRDQGRPAIETIPHPGAGTEVAFEVFEPS